MSHSHRLVGDANTGSGRPIVNTHLHVPPNFSAFETAEDAVRIAAAEGVAAIGTSNYFDFNVYRQFASAAAEAGVVPLFGMEIITLTDDLPDGGMLINDPTNLNRMYLCGKALSRIDAPVPSAARRMAAIRASSDDRIRRMTGLMATTWVEAGLACELTERGIAEAVAQRCGVPLDWVSLQERHVAQAFQEILFREVPEVDRPAALARVFGRTASFGAADPVAVQDAIRSNLMKAGRPAFVPEAAVSFDDAYRLILDLGGIPCYPILADGASPICPFEDPAELLAERLLGRGIYCAELIPVRNRGEVVDRYVAVLRGAGIVLTAGTEHNTRRMIPIEPTALGGEPLSDSAREAFWEGTCIVAAHQALTAAGRPGYVDGEGRLTGASSDRATRIRELTMIGAEIINNLPAARALA